MLKDRLTSNTIMNMYQEVIQPNSINAKEIHQTRHSVPLLLPQVVLILVENTPPQRTNHGRPGSDVIFSGNISCRRWTDRGILLTRSPIYTRSLTSTPVYVLLSNPLPLAVVLSECFGQGLHLTLALTGLGGVRYRRRVRTVGLAT